MPETNRLQELSYMLKRYFIVLLSLFLSPVSVQAAQPPSVGVEEPLHYGGAMYRLWCLARDCDTIVLAEQIENNVMPVSRGLYEVHHIKVRILETLKGAPLTDEYIMYSAVYEVNLERGEKPGREPGVYPQNGQILLGFNMAALSHDPRFGCRHAGDLTFFRLSPTALRHLPQVKQDFPQLFSQQ